MALLASPADREKGQKRGEEEVKGRDQEEINGRKVAELNGKNKDKQDVSPNEQTRSCRALCNTVLETSNSSTCVRDKSVRILIKQTIRGVLSAESCVGPGEAYINARPHNKVYKCLSTLYALSSEETHRRAGMLVASAPRVAFI